MAEYLIHHLGYKKKSNPELLFFARSKKCDAHAIFTRHLFYRFHLFTTSRDEEIVASMKWYFSIHYDYVLIHAHHNKKEILLCTKVRSTNFVQQKVRSHRYHFCVDEISVIWSIYDHRDQFAHLLVTILYFLSGFYFLEEKVVCYKKWNLIVTTFCADEISVIWSIYDHRDQFAHLLVTILYFLSGFYFLEEKVVCYKKWNLIVTTFCADEISGIRSIYDHRDQSAHLLFTILYFARGPYFLEEKVESYRYHFSR
jgi:hypothetical protein